MRAFLLLAIAIFCFCPTGKAQQRRVLYEGFTSETCPPSVSADNFTWTLLRSGANAANVQVVTYSAPWMSEGPIFKAGKAFYLGRLNFYSNQFVPSYRLDGQLHDTNTQYPGHAMHLTQATVDTEVARPAPFNLAATHSMNSLGDTVHISVEVVCASDVTANAGNMKIYAALVRSLNYTNPPGTTSQVFFYNMARAIYKAPIADAWTQTMHQTYTLSGAVPSELADSVARPHTSTPDQYVVWVQDDSSREVHQVATSIQTLSVAGGSRESLEISIAPNPVVGNPQVQVTMPRDASAGISVVDASGRLMLTRTEQLKKGRQELRLNTEQLPPGNYFLLAAVEGRLQVRSFAVR